MPAKDIYHNTVITALEKDKWIITNDPLVIRWGKKDLYIDLGAEKLIAAEKDNQKIAIEIKSFVGKSAIDDIKSG
ncbi:element excision factor XisH family protein [Okeania sp. SIO3B5]|uniref:element excision factor XisH family protein n=1 Tax=Okeania sp. SIO3B5 TaxID=2607811 RepID=UPI0034572B42